MATDLVWSGWVGGGGEESCGIGIGFGSRVILRAQGLHAPEHSFHSASDSHATAILCALKMSTFTSRLTPVDRTTPDCVRATFKWSAQACFHDRDIRSQVQEECKGPKKSQEGGNTQKSFPSSPFFSRTAVALLNLYATFTGWKQAYTKLCNVESTHVDTTGFSVFLKFCFRLTVCAFLGRGRFLISLCARSLEGGHCHLSNA